MTGYLICAGAFIIAAGLAWGLCLHGARAGQARVRRARLSLREERAAEERNPRAARDLAEDPHEHMSEDPHEGREAPATPR